MRQNLADFSNQQAFEALKTASCKSRFLARKEKLGEKRAGEAALIFALNLSPGLLCRFILRTASPLLLWRKFARRLKF